MKLAVWCPMKAEARALGTQPANSNIPVSVSGIGRKKSLSYAAAHQHLDLDLLMIVGYGGALDAGLKMGQIFIADEVMARTKNKSSGTKDKEDKSSGHNKDKSELQQRVLEPARQLIEKLNLPSVETGAVYTSSVPVFGRKKRKELHGLGARVVDMESWWLLQSLPEKIAQKTAVIRVISDTRAIDILKLRKHLKTANQSLKELGSAIAGIAG